MKRLAERSLCLIAILAAAGMAAAALLREDERVEKLMERTHEGRRSPHRLVKAQAAAAQPAWATVEAALPRFDAMAEALLESPDAEIKDSADGYVDAVKSLGTATRKRDAQALREAVAALEQSCGDCHYKGGVGGELEHGHGRGQGRERGKEDEEEDEEDEEDEEEDEEECEEED